MSININATQKEQQALDYAKKAVEADQKGLRTLALNKYQLAIDSLTEIVKHYPSSPLSHIYTKKIREYKERITFLKGMITSDIRGAVSPLNNNKNIENTDHDVEIEYESEDGMKWDDIIGLDKIKQTLKQSIIYPSIRPDLFPLGWPRGILLYGPPGCGKTSLAAAVSSEIDGSFYAIDATTIMSKWLGEAEKNVSNVFNQLRQKCLNGKPVILFIDEVDSLLGIRTQEVGGEVRVRNQFLKEMDGLSDKTHKKLALYVIAATNKPWTLDWGFIRRFQRRIFVPSPQNLVRKLLFSYYLKDIHVEDNLDITKLSIQTEGYTSSDIRDICQSALIDVVTEIFENGESKNPDVKPRAVNIHDLINNISRIKPSINPETIKIYEGWADQFRAH